LKSFSSAAPVNTTGAHFPVIRVKRLPQKEGSSPLRDDDSNSLNSNELTIIRKELLGATSTHPPVLKPPIVVAPELKPAPVPIDEPVTIDIPLLENSFQVESLHVPVRALQLQSLQRVIQQPEPNHAFSVKHLPAIGSPARLATNTDVFELVTPPTLEAIDRMPSKANIRAADYKALTTCVARYLRDAV
jgi:hypothetical protein